MPLPVLMPLHLPLLLFQPFHLPLTILLFLYQIELLLQHLLLLQTQRLLKAL
jgi:hypothetical protein